MEQIQQWDSSRSIVGAFFPEEVMRLEDPMDRSSGIEAGSMAMDQDRREGHVDNFGSPATPQFEFQNSKCPTSHSPSLPVTARSMGQWRDGESCQLEQQKRRRTEEKAIKQRSHPASPSHHRNSDFPPNPTHSCPTKMEPFFQPSSQGHSSPQSSPEHMEHPNPHPSIPENSAWKTPLPKPSKNKIKLSYHAPSTVEGKTLVCPPREVIKAGQEKWSASLVGYFLEKKPHYDMVKKAAERAWGNMGLKAVTLPANDFFLFSFDSKEDSEKVILEGPWSLVGRSIVLQPWIPGFKFEKSKISTIPIWVRLSNIPVELWTKEGLSWITSALGRPLHLELLTEHIEVVKYARVQVEMDRNSPFPLSIPIMLEDEIQEVKVDYAWKPTPCLHCGDLEHKSSECHRKSVNIQKTSQAGGSGSSIKVAAISTSGKSHLEGVGAKEDSRFRNQYISQKTKETSATISKYQGITISQGREDISAPSATKVQDQMQEDSSRAGKGKEIIPFQSPGDSRGSKGSQDMSVDSEDSEEFPLNRMEVLSQVKKEILQMEDSEREESDTNILCKPAGKFMEISHSIRRERSREDSKEPDSQSIGMENIEQQAVLGPKNLCEEEIVQSTFQTSQGEQEWQ